MHVLSFKFYYVIYNRCLFVFYAVGPRLLSFLQILTLRRWQSCHMSAIL